MEEAMLVCPDLIEVVSEALVTSEASVAIMDGPLEDDEGKPEFNDMPRELNTLLAALRLRFRCVHLAIYQLEDPCRRRLIVALVIVL
jgi:hypothetical protein